MAFKRARSEEQVDIRLKSIRKAALSLYDKTGEAGVTFENVARKTGLTRPALYSYYENRHELLLDLLNEEFSDLNSSIRENPDIAAPVDAQSFSCKLADTISSHRRFIKLFSQCAIIFDNVSCVKLLSVFDCCYKEFIELISLSVKNLTDTPDEDSSLRYAKSVAAAVCGVFQLSQGTNRAVSEVQDAVNTSALTSFEDDLRVALRLLTQGAAQGGRKSHSIKQALSEVLKFDEFL